MTPARGRLHQHGVSADVCPGILRDKQVAQALTRRDAGSSNRLMNRGGGLRSPDILGMMAPARPTLYLFCGKIASGKSTLAGRLAQRPATLLVTMDDWMSTLFPTENRTIDDFARLSARLRAAIGPHLVEILKQGLSIALDFPANTVDWRCWMMSLITETDVAHELHLLDVPDAICQVRLRKRNDGGEHPYQVNDATFDLFTSYFVPPGPDENFNIVIHT